MKVGFPFLPSLDTISSCVCNLIPSFIDFVLDILVSAHFAFVNNNGKSVEMLVSFPLHVYLGVECLDPVLAPFFIFEEGSYYFL